MLQEITKFTDKDLQKLKTKEGYWHSTIPLNKGQSASWGFVDGEKIDALIVRLEAAEHLIHTMYKFDAEDSLCPTMAKHNALVDEVREATQRWVEVTGK